MLLLLNVVVMLVAYQLKLKSVETEQFPAKTVLKWSPKVLEHRRQVFEKYLQVRTFVCELWHSVVKSLALGAVKSHRI